MGHTGTHDTITCPACGHTDEYYYGFDHDVKTGTFDFSGTNITCSKCGSLLMSWQEKKYGGRSMKRAVSISADVGPDFEPGDCADCPFAFTDSDAYGEEYFRCILGRRYDECPIDDV